ncbi:MAG: DNA mismatch repair protein MutS [Verrucomicrobiota bacterium]|nr:DNA mismatch repair protein MutS [Verrucomicrobiota bacterium]
MAITPMMQQYLDVRRELPANTLLLFRLGDFYELFDEDARIGSQILGLTLTQRNGQPMAGLPYHAADAYIQRILAAGRKVAVCDQMEPPRPGKIVKRALTRILSPGTTLEDHQVDARKNHYLLALDFAKDNGFHAAWLDLTTGDYAVAGEGRADQLLSVFTALDPREVIVPEQAWARWRALDAHDSGHKALLNFCNDRPLSTLADYQFAREEGLQRVLETLKVLSVEGFGLTRMHPALGAAGALIHYATESLCAPPGNLRTLREYRPGGVLLLDPATLRNLEIFRGANGSREGSLLAAMDGTVTAPGARLLERWLAAPPLELVELKRRQCAVGELLEAPGMTGELQEYLKCVRDLPRILGRLRNRLKNPRELGGLRDTLQQIPLIRQILAQYDGDSVRGVASRLSEQPELCDLLERGLADDLPNELVEGGFIRDTYDAELDHLRSLTRDSKSWITSLEAEEQKRTGIKNLKIRYTGAFGYYIEITKSNLHLVPDDYIRKQTVVNAERYYTTSLKEKEKEILHADEKSIARETELFEALSTAVLDKADSLEATAAALAEIDVLAGWTRLAREWDYCKPELDEGDVLEIESGRHPVVEQTLRRERHGLAGTRSFVPNDTLLSASDEQVAIITGPNMAGKSTYIRQVALIALMAQTGCWVPAKRCHIGLVDRVFSRVGASDELARGNSTFMVEMNETANILNNATPRSLIILDEIGRGTSTYDGLAIAWAVVEYLHGSEERGPRTLFATHYHELTQIDRQCARVRNYSVAVKEWNDEIIFVRQVKKGAADRSYGIQVARLAGLPVSVINRAKEVLEKLEADDSSHNLLRRRLKTIRNAEANGKETGQMALF